MKEGMAVEIRSTLYDPHGSRRWTTGVAAERGTTSSSQKAELVRSKAAGTSLNDTSTSQAKRKTRTSSASGLSSTLTVEERELLDRLFPMDRVGRGIRSYRSSSISARTGVWLGRRIDVRQ